MPIFDVEVGAEILEELIDRAKSGEEIVIRDGSDLVKLEPVIADIATIGRDSPAV